ncbi:LOW QUALITY PROTEIN: integrin alpha-X-like [Leucoraja erinacea]|uniref:LOW QUALITY PROTEIN: integrin alpha-X-like n=1 Tax=Leucoraja erinaceus TaxID=7782 RepID=UPI0024558B74|nr:LOW QUALITY PROTEIN: integrin alpha-X-like [Leucoraja erinacea]
MTTGENKAVVCIPRFSYECFTNTYINGFCYDIDRTLNHFARVPKNLPVCPKVSLDLAFLIDGSGSVRSRDFLEMKVFVKAMMTKFASMNTQIAVVQFSSNVQTEFDFHKYNSAWDKTGLVDAIRQTGGGTNTPNGMKYVADRIFNPASGARDNAKRILITITDGESQNRYFQPAVDAAKRKRITRYAIGVGSAFSNTNAKAELQTIASEIGNVFQVGNFQALDQIQNQLQEKIFAIEGTEKKGESSFQLEMAQEGISSLVTEDSIVYGAAGAYDWSGGIYQSTSGIQPFINATFDRDSMKNAYLGYSVEEARGSRGRYYVAGAPRYRHRGLVLVYNQRWLSHHTKKIESTQMGSYFGSVLCAVDLNNDGVTDLILVGAPHHSRPATGGMVFVYKFQEGDLSPRTPLVGEGGEQPLARFGASIARLGDLNGDGVADVAVGAPLEDGNSGSVYIFLGSADGLKGPAAQHIRSADVKTGLRFFGRAIHGAIDVSSDGLSDFAVGALGKVVVFRSQPVVDVKVHTTFDPPKIKLKDVDCPKNSQRKPEVLVMMCFTLRELTKKLPASPKFNMFMKMVLDPGRKVQRAEVTEAPPVNFTMQNDECLNFTIQLENCIQDTYNNIQLDMTYVAKGQRSGMYPAPILKQGSTGIWSSGLPFEQECGSDNICTDRLKVSFSMSGTQFLVVGSHTTLGLDVSLENCGENSYFTVVTFLIPRGLSFRKTEIVQSNRRGKIECNDGTEPAALGLRSVRCLISHPIFRTNSMMKFHTVFDVDPQADWKDTVEISVNASSNNEAHDTRGSFQLKRIIVKYEVNVIIKGIDSTQYINFTTSKAETKTISHAYKVENLEQRSLAVSITFLVHVKIWPGLTWDDLQVSSPWIRVKSCQKKLDLPQIEEMDPSKKCNKTSCTLFVCDIQSLRYRDHLVFNIAGNISWSNPALLKAEELKLSSFARVRYDEKKYIHISQATTKFKEATVATRVEVVKEQNMLPVIVGSTVGGLILLLIVAAVLYKVGFFKRGFKEKLEEATDETGDAGGAVDQPSVPQA